MREPLRFVPGNTAWSPKLDPSRCEAAVHEGEGRVGFRQCCRKRKYGAWCAHHDPGHIKQRQSRQQARAQVADDKRRRREVALGLALATDDELLAEVRRRKLRMSR